ncbi:MAG: hypothetical protein JNK81_13550 [Anaerolineales bacterium]|nr:hypothetical protein [Anaerolineales bacterium]
MKKTLSLLFLLFLTACDTWGVAPQPFPVWTAIPSSTPSIVTATPLVIPPPALTVISQVTETPTQIPPPSFTPTIALPTSTFTLAPIQSVDIVILGCNTSIDILRGMGEVTNAYVTLKNTGTVDLPNACGFLRAIDEDREHPDKKVCVSNLPAQHQVILKLTVDSTYRQDTVIQVDALSNEVVLLRIDKQSCRDISLFGGAPSDVGVIKPIQP